MTPEHFEYLNRESALAWDQILKQPLGHLKLCAAQWARYDTERDQGSTALHERREHLKGKASGYIQEANPQAVLDDYVCRQFVLRVWPNGIVRLERRVKERA